MSNEEQVIVQAAEEQDNQQPTAHDAEVMIKEALAQAKAPPIEKEEEAAPEPPKKGYDYVKFDTPEQQERVNYLYKQVKASDETNKIIREEHGHMARALEVALQKLDSLESRQAKETEDKETGILRAKIRHARETGEDDQADQLNEKLIELKAEQRFKAEENRKTREELERQKEALKNAPVSMFSSEEIAYANSLKDEKHADGAPVRPWMDGSDEDFELAQNLAVSITKNLEKQGKKADLETVFQKLDERMFGLRGGAPREKPKPTQPSVLSGNGNVTPPKTNVVQLNAAQKMAAKKLGISESSYARSMQLASRAHSVSIDDL